MGARVLVAAALGVLLAGCSSSGGTGSAPALGTGTAVTFDARPVLCYAPPFTPGPIAPPAGAPLPACAPPYELTAAHLHVRLNTNAYAGYTDSKIPPDPQFAPYRSTPRASDLPSRDVLLPGAPTTGTRDRYVLGPASLTRASVTSALAYDEGGQWVDNVVLTGQGSVSWEALARTQFHALVAFVVNGVVLVATLIQPTQSSYSSSEGVIQIVAGLSEQQTKALAAELS